MRVTQVLPLFLFAIFFQVSIAHAQPAPVQMPFLEPTEAAQLKVIGPGLNDRLNGKTLFLACKTDSCENTQLLTQTKKPDGSSTYQWSGIVLRNYEKRIDELTDQEYRIAKYLLAGPPLPEEAQNNFMLDCAKKNIQYNYGSKWSLKNKLDFDIMDHPRFGMVYKHINKIAFVFKGSHKRVSDADIYEAPAAHVSLVDHLFSD